MAEKGVAPLHGSDISAEMLALAETKRVYDRLFEGDLTERLPVEDGAYAGAVSAGTFTHGHVGPAALAEVLRILRSGGLAVLSVNAEHWQAQGFEAHLERLAEGIAASERRAVPIYGAGSEGAHAADLAFLLVLRRA